MCCFPIGKSWAALNRVAIVDFVLIFSFWLNGNVCVCVCFLAITKSYILRKSCLKLYSYDKRV